MDETTSNGNINWTTTASTNATLTFIGTDTWFPYYQESTWLPYTWEKYYPTVHLLKSFGITKNHSRHSGRVSGFLEKLKEYFGLDGVFVSHCQRLLPK